MDFHKLMDNDNIHIIMKNQKTSQFRHIFEVFELVKEDFDFYMYCDDDDTYKATRVEHFMNAINFTLSSKHKIDDLMGVYENHKKINTQVNYLEFWNYCISKKYIQELLTKLNDGGYYYHVDNVMFDMFYGAYFRYIMSRTKFFVEINVELYNHNDYENSITGIITKNNKRDKPTIVNYSDYIENDIAGFKNHIFLDVANGLDVSVDKMLWEQLGIKRGIIKPNIMKILDDYYTELKTWCLDMGFNYFGQEEAKRVIISVRG